MRQRILDRFDQPIHSPDSRLVHEIPLRFVRRVAGKLARSVNFELPLIPFIDFLLCVVLFLLASFSANGEPLDERLTPPVASNTLDLVEAPMIAIVGPQLLIDGVPAGTVHEVVDVGRLQRLDGLANILQAKRSLWLQLNPGREFPGVVLLYADRQVPALVIKSVFQTAAHAGYPNLSFVVGKTENPRG